MATQAQIQAQLLARAAISHEEALKVVAALLVPTVPVTSASSVQDIIGLINGVQSPLAGELNDLPDLSGKVSGDNLENLIKQLNKGGRRRR